MTRETDKVVTATDKARKYVGQGVIQEGKNSTVNRGGQVAGMHVRTDRSDSENGLGGWRSKIHLPIAIQAQEGTYGEHLLNRFR